MGKRLDWKANLPGIRAMIEAGCTGAEIARKYGISADTCYAGLRKYGLQIKPEATLAARTAACVRMSTDPVLMQRRSRAMAKVMQQPEKREWARQHWADVRARHPDVHLRGCIAGRSPEAMAKRREKALANWARVQSWLPDAWRDEYRRLVRSKGFTAAEAKRIVLDEIEREQAAAARLAGERLRQRAEAMMRGGGRARISPTLEPVA